ncbi:MAG: EAL domain-containing protein [Cyanobacteria bacterium J06631_2]
MNKINILIVEDELLIAENLADKLRKLKYNVVDIVSSGNAAFKKVNAQCPDLILMDIAIKGNMDGIETAAKIRFVYDVPIIFLTAYADDKTLERAGKTGCYGYLLKLFKDRELHASIKMALNKHREQSQIQESLQSKIKEYAAKCSPANIDRVTRLPNRLALRDLFEYILSEENGAIASQDVNSQKSELPAAKQNLTAVMYFEIDRFKRIFNSLDNEARSLLLIAISECITSSLLDCDGATATIKLDNSEFIILVSGIKQQQLGQDLANQILDKFRKSFIVNNLEFFLTASIGINFCHGRNEVDIEKLLSQAHLAMSYAQEGGGDGYKVYNNSLKLAGSIVGESLTIETELHYALKRQELQVYYQPKVELKTGRIIAAEALVRWHHPKMGLVMPSQFIAIAEQSSLIESIGEWVLATACRQTQAWHQLGYPDLAIAVNLSGRQFKQLDLFHRVTQILFDSGLKAEFLELELTEKILVENEKLNIQRLNLIKKLDIQISLDDFGTGYSSLSYLKQFPFDVLKIDRSFVSQIEQNSKNSVIVKSVIEMAHKLDLKVVAEGVETQSELEYLVGCDCDIIQGYLFSRPVPAQDFEKLLCEKNPFDLASLKLSKAKV